MPLPLYGVYLILFATMPWAMEWPIGQYTYLTCPTEPLIIAALLLHLFCLKSNWSVFVSFFKEKQLFSIVLGCYVVGLLISSATSVMPIVSFKYVSVEIAHLLVFFFGLILWPMTRNKLSAVFVLSMIGAVVWTLVRRAYLFDWRNDQAILAPMPFFSDHNIYAAVAMLSIGLLARQDKWTFWLKMGIGVLLAGATVLSTSRAGLISLVLVGSIGFVLYAFPKSARNYILIFGILFALLSIKFGGPDILAAMKRDVSFAERLNRYSCATRMIADRPVFGFGPGTFQYTYVPYQLPEEQTRLSLTKPLERRGIESLGRGGGAHSEYLQAWVEMGFGGLLLWVALLGYVVYALWNRWPRTIRQMIPALALLSFLIHAMFNNFIHDARVAALVWVLIAEIRTSNFPCRF